MKNIPERIFLNIQEDDIKEFNDFSVMNRRSVITWSECQIYDDDIEYVKKDFPWINVNERLPNEDEIVLCRMKSNGAIVSGYIFISPGGYACVSTSPNFEFEDYGGYECDMWMPIPKIIV